MHISVYMYLRRVYHFTSILGTIHVPCVTLDRMPGKTTLANLGVSPRRFIYIRIPSQGRYS